MAITPSFRVGKTMKKLNRRLFASAAAASLLAPGAFAQEAEPPPVDKVLLNTPPANGEMVLGKDDAKVTIIEYASASCPHCAEFANVELPKLTKDYIDSGKVKLIFREFPHNEAALGAFMVARCAPKEKYFPLVEVFFKTQQKWVPNPYEGLKEIALQAGFTAETFEACTKNSDIAKAVIASRDVGDKLGVQGIPTFFINGERYKGEYTLEAMKTVIDPLLG
jgi:protein-disulfide isomerase